MAPLIRTAKHYVESYNQNLSDSRNGYNRRENGKYHYSVIEEMVFPVKSLDRVVPPGLHIMLGIMLNIYNLILDECRQIDEKEKESTNEERQQEISNDWELKSIELEDKTRKLREIGEEFVEIENRCARIESVVAGDQKKNLELSKGPFFANEGQCFQKFNQSLRIWCNLACNFILVRIKTKSCSTLYRRPENE